MKKEFKAESKQLLELMINSIYSNSEIFLRELISNASDALDKRHFISLVDYNYINTNPRIEIVLDKKKRTITIKDNGIGMNEVELEENLGTIAHSGSKEFKKQIEEKQGIDVIGQFGVGFYASFIVSDEVEVISKKVNEDAYHWQSQGIDSYEIKKVDSLEDGTTIILHLKSGKDYDIFLDANEIESLIKKYSDFIKYPIMMEKEIKEYDKDEDGKILYDKYQIKKSIEIINSQQALWKKDKKEIKQEDYDNFYMSQFHDWQKPLKTIHAKVEGNLNYEMLLYIPAHRGFDFYTPTYKNQLELYSKSVFIEDNVDYLLPSGFKFIKGIIDSEDLSLNISREMLQKDRNVIKLAAALEKKVKNEILKMQKNNRELYNKFYDEFGLQLMYGIYDNFGEKKDLLKDLIMFKSTKDDNYVTLSEYVNRMKENQEEILYVSGSSIEQINKLPIMEQALLKEEEILYFTNEIDEFVINVLMECENKKFKSIAHADYQADESAKKEIDKKIDENKDLLSSIKDALSNDVSEVTLTSRLKNSPVFLATKDNISLEMEKTLANMPDAGGIKANKVLELNPDHELFNSLNKIYKNDPEKIKDYAKILYNQALLVEGMSIEDPSEYANLLTKLMIDASK